MFQPECRQKLPLSVESFARLRATNQYYVDKTLLIRDVIQQAGDPLLFTRPRRFGKTLNMFMLRTFFEKTDTDPIVYFEGTNIMDTDSEITGQMGMYPVIFLTFKDTEGDSSESIIDGIRGKIRNEYMRHTLDLMDREAASFECSENKRRFICDRIERFESESLSESAVVDSLNNLSMYLCQLYGVAPVILIDEYDAPVRRAWALRNREPASYDKVVDFMRRLLSSTFKSNLNVSYACLTGIDRVAMSSGESGLNNLRVFGVLAEPFAQYFGFTHEEVKVLLETYGMSDKYAEVCEWYQGYRFGNVEMFNPVSVLNYLEQGGTPKAYWPLTSINATIGDALEYATPEVISDVSKLAIGETVQADVLGSLVYPDLPYSPEAIFTLLLGDGYLTAANPQRFPNTAGSGEQTLVIPNKELRLMYEKEVYSKANKVFSGNLKVEYDSIRDAIMSGDARRFQEALRKLLLTVLGPNDIGGKKKEDAYHMLLVGLLAPVMGNYVLASNGNAGEGRYDISLTPINPRDPAVVIEVKAESDQTDEKLKKLASKALAQIDSKRYVAQPGWKGRGRILKYGVAFSKKRVQVACSLD